jgi:hypothetical protein
MIKEPIAVNNKDWQNLIGIQHALTGEQSPATGLNCYSLLREVYKGLSIELPARAERRITTDLLATEGANWIKIPEPEPYCAALMLNKSETGKEHFHVGVITPEGGLLHSTHGKGVIHSKLSKYEHCIVGYYAYKPGEGNVTLPDAGDGDIGRVIGMVVVAIIAIILTVPTAGGSLAVFGAGGAAGFGALGASIASMAIMMVGGLLVNMLCPVSNANQDDFTGFGAGGAKADTRTYTWDGIMNETRQGLVKPMTFGRILIGGQVISEKTWYDSTGLLNYYNTLICPAKNRITRFEQFYINDSAAEYYSDVILNTRLGDDEQTVIPGFEEIYTQYSSGAKILWDFSSVNPSVSHVVAFSSKAKCTGVRMNIVGPNGLFSMDPNTGNKTARTVNFRIQHKKVSEDSTKWKFAYSDYVWAGSTTFDNAANFTGRIVKGFDTNAEVEGFKFTLTANRIITLVPEEGYWEIDPPLNYVITVPWEGEYFGWSKYKVWYKSLSDAEWTLYNTYEFGYNGAISPASDTINIEVSGLSLAKYQVRVDFVDDVHTEDIPEHGSIYDSIYTEEFAVTAIETATGTAVLSIAGNSSSPGTSVAKSFDMSGLDEDFHDFRIWRTTEDVISPYWRFDIYLKDYSEVLPVALAYPGHALVGLQAIATERLSGSRPKVSQIVIGEPLSVPEASKQYNTTVASDGGVQVDGLRSVRVNIVLPTWDTVSYFWLVRMDSTGYAQPDRLLTKFFLRVVSWREVATADETIPITQTDLFIESSEEIPAGTSVMLFAEADAPTDNTAWVLAKMLIEGSRGRITEDKIHWPSFAVWNTWNEELVLDSVTGTYRKRHQFDGVIDFQSDLWSIALTVASSARGMILASGGKYKVVADKAGTPVQVFSEGNTKNAVVNPIPRTERANIIVTSFNDERNMFTSTTISEEDVQGNEFPIVKTVDLKVGITREFQVRNNMRWMLAHNRYVDHTTDFEAGTDSIECEVGDVFMFQSKVADFAFGGRIKGLSERETGEVETISRTVSLADTTLSSADGYAFFDASGPNLNYPGCKFTVIDSTGKKRIGYIEALGTGETFSNELFLNGDFAADTDWYKPSGWTISGGTANVYAIFGGSERYIVQSVATLGAAFETVHTVSSYTLGHIGIRFNGTLRGISRGANGTYTERFTSVASDNMAGYVNIGLPIQLSIDNVSLKRILTPSATGVTIVSTPGGTDHNWASVEAGFNPNDPAGFTYEIEVPIIEPTVLLDQKMTANDEEYELTVWAKEGPVRWSGNLNGVDIEELPRPAGLPDAMPYEYPFILSKLSDDRTKYRALNIKTSTTTMFSTITGVQYKDEIYAND